MNCHESRCEHGGWVANAAGVEHADSDIVKDGYGGQEGTHTHTFTGDRRGDRAYRAMLLASSCAEIQRKLVYNLLSA